MGRPNGTIAVQRESPPSILIVSDVLLYREGVAAGLAQSAAFEVAGAVSSRDAMDAVDRLRPAAVLVDAAASDVLPLARRLKAEHPQMTLIGFGISCDDGSLACAEAGLTGFVGRDGTIADLVAAVKAALAGEVGCSPRLAALFCARLATLSGNPPTGNAQLTLREHQIAELAAQGLSNKEIAITLAIGPATVKNHVHNILEKLNLPRRGAIGARLRSMVAV